MYDKEMHQMRLLCLIFVLAVALSGLAAQAANTQTVPLAVDTHTAQFMYLFDKKLDTTIWTVENGTWEGTRANYTPANVVLEGDMTRLKTLPLNRPRNGKNYSAGHITTKQFFGYGTFTARLRAPLVPGVVGDFMLMNPWTENWNQQEIDTLFNGAGKGSVLLDSLHVPAGRPREEIMYTHDTGFDYATEFHDYTVIWSRDKPVWKVDGVQVYESRDNVPDLALQISFISHPVFGESMKHPYFGRLDSKTLPAYFDIMWVNYTPEE